MLLLSSMRPLLLMLLWWSTGTTPEPAPLQDDAEAGIKKTIGQLFEGMRKGDSSMVKGAFAAGAVLQTISSAPGKPVTVRTEPLQAFLNAVGKPHTDVWDERIEFGHIGVDDKLAAVWTPYKFYLGQQFSHCGVNSFQLVKLEEGWKIVYLIDTRRKQCD